MRDECTEREETPRVACSGVPISDRLRGIPDPESIAGAIEQLERSECGRVAAVALRRLIENGGRGLDLRDWGALETLCRAARLYGGAAAYQIADVLPRR